METYIIQGKRIAARSMAQAMFAAQQMVKAGKLKPLTPSEEQKARRTQYHAK